jgi:ribosomal protein S27AE
MPERLDALTYWWERQYGEKVPQCPNCGATGLVQRHVRASFDCYACGYEIGSHVIKWIPANESARLPEESWQFQGLGWPTRPREGGPTA